MASGSHELLIELKRVSLGLLFTWATILKLLFVSFCTVLLHHSKLCVALDKVRISEWYAISACIWWMIWSVRKWRCFEGKQSLVLRLYLVILLYRNASLKTWGGVSFAQLFRIPPLDLCFLWIQLFTNKGKFRGTLYCLETWKFKLFLIVL